MVQIINIQGKVPWFYRQLLRLAGGGEPDLSQGLLSALGQHARGEWRLWGRRRDVARAHLGWRLLAALAV